MKTQQTYRAWINQPSNLQPLHSEHGKRGIVRDDGGATVRVWFTEGKCHSMEVPRQCVSQLHLSNAVKGA